MKTIALTLALYGYLLQIGVPAIGSPGFSPPAGPTPTQVQIKNGTATFGATSRSFTYTNSLAGGAGDVSVVAFMTTQSLGTGACGGPVCGTLLGSYTQISSSPGPTGYTKYVYCKAGSAGSETVTVTVASSGTIMLGGEEWSNSTCTADGTPVSGGPTSSSGPWSSGNLTNTHGTTLLVCLYSDGAGTGGQASNSGYTNDMSPNANFTIFTKPATTNGTQNCTGTLTASETWTVSLTGLAGI